MNLSVEQKVAYCSGDNFWSTKELPGVPSFTMSDGPHGLRKQEDAADMLGINNSVPATCFPAAASTACSWNPELLSQVGEAIAKEAASHGVGLVLGPGANIKRNPLCGRNFEYFSEDPYLTGKLAAGYIRGAEATGVATSLKHFALNNQEYKRFSSDSVVDERTMREIYLAGFEAAVKEGKPSVVMSSYNKINGVHSSDNVWLLTDVLRNEWGFDGMVVTDWGGMNDRTAGFVAGCDLSMPGGSAYLEREAVQAVESGALDIACVDKSVHRIQALAHRAKSAVEGAEPVDMEQHYQLARRAAVESAVLLKNHDGLLPLAQDACVVFIGAMAKKLRYQGSGSSHINPWKLTTVAQACPDVAFAQGCTEQGETSVQLLEEAVEAAKNAQVAVVFAGLTDKYESEGFDRENMQMPAGHNQLIEAVSQANPNTVVVLMCGSAVETPWFDQVKSILYMGLPGEAGGEAVRDLLFGEAVPSGKLAETWPLSYDDCVSSTYYAGTRKDAHYREGIYVGYRYYASADVPVRFPFGHGLSYTTFSYSDLVVQGNVATCTVTNEGMVAGWETAQLYVAPPEGSGYRAALELKGFSKVYLEPGQSAQVSFTLDDRSFAVWADGWVVPAGTYTVMVGGSSQDLSLSAQVEKQGSAPELSALPDWYLKPQGIPTHEDFEALVGHAVAEKPLAKGTFTMENSIMEMRDYSFVMKIMFKIMEIYVAKGYSGNRDYSDITFRMLMSSAADCSLSGMKICSGMKNHVFEGILHMANGHFFKGLVEMLKK